METLVFRSEDQEKIEALKAVAKALKIDFESVESSYDSEFVARIGKTKKQEKVKRLVWMN
jgi:inosine/xanthosine triphosphate pyrophosphatase family protein